MHSTFVAEALLKAADTAVTGSLVDIQGEPFYRVANHDAMAPFLMSLVSDSDLWLFISSNGALSAGRKDPDHALFPYYTDDRIHDSQDQTGSRTLLRIVRDGRTSLWEPFSQRFDGLYRTARSLAKSVYGNRILFQEDNLDLGLSFRYEWMSSERFGFVRRAALVNLGADPVAVEMVDGIQNVLPWGIERRFQAEYSTLADGYKRTERIPGTALALFRMSSIPVDKPEPSEALRVNLAWCAGLEPDRLLLSTDQLGAFRRGEPLQDETDVRGRRGAYLMNAAFTLAPAAERDWLVVADLGQDAAQVIALRRQLLGAGLKDAVMEDVARGSAKLLRIVASSDGLQMTGDPLNTARHYSNTLFNVLRGGIPDDGYRISRADLKRFMGQCNKEVARSQGAFLDSLPETLGHGELLRRVARQEDPDLERLAQ